MGLRLTVPAEARLAQHGLTGMPRTLPGPTPIGEPGSPPIRRRRSHLRRVAWAGGLVVLALTAMFVWSELNPAALRDAEAAYRRNSVELALTRARDHLASRPSSRAAALIAARCLSRLDRPDQAEPFYQKAGRLSLEDQHGRALALVRGNSRKQAILAFQEILARSPDDVLALRRLAAVQISESLWSDAIATAARLIEIPEGAVIGHTLAGVVHHNTESPEQSVAEFGRVLELDPKLERMPLTPRTMFWVYFGQDLLTIGRPAEARRLLDRAMNEEGGNPKIADLLGQSHYQQGAVDDAERCWRLALEWDRNRAETWWRIGRIELQRGQIEEAISSLRRANELEPTAVGPVYGLSMAYRRLGKKEEADRLQAEADRLRIRSGPPRGGMGAMPNSGS
jgi:tetratricopeptide (TPR) repeat protein